jgi:hypothetical protein
VTFRIVSTGWSCPEWIEQTLRSIESQSVQDFVVQIVYDGGDAGDDIIREWCDSRDERWRYIINEKQMYAPHNQFLAMAELAPADDDIVVFLDLDGDQFAHPDVLAHLLEYYADDTLLTYGSYLPVPSSGSTPSVLPFPPEVIRTNSYRAYMRDGGPCSFNHLRTMKGKIANAIPSEHAKWSDGSWHVSGGDYLVMVSGLELAGGRHKLIEEVLLHYNNANPKADYLMHGPETTQCNVKFLREPPLAPLDGIRVPQ